MSSNNYNGYVSYPAQTRNGVFTSQNTLSRREVYNAPSSGFTTYPDQRNANFSATPDAAMTFKINQEVEVWSDSCWVRGVIIGGLHYIKASDTQGYTVNFLAGIGRSVEKEFPQEYIRAAPTSMQYT